MAASLESLGYPLGTGDAFDLEFPPALADSEKRLPPFLSVTRNRSLARMAASVLPVHPPPGTGGAFDAEFPPAFADYRRRLPSFPFVAGRRSFGDPRGFISVRRQLP